ncbi:MAG: DUF3488 domain-containing protein, partial [Planctomycetota bacterium]|nr:DUF3488 domain-containing protein [Planctomycetota bacterium]
MNHALRLAMVGLVLVNLGFVQITDAANWTWLGPLFGLTIGAPWLVKMTRFFWYRALWNVAVLGTFGILVHRFTGVGVQHLLGDGLLLAALCQVHLLNNLTEKQRPDLLFFNSFLIAVVTSYLSVDLPYLTLFLAYVPIAIFGLQMLSLTNSRAVVTGSLVGRVAWQTVRRSVVVLGLTVTAFFFFPRDFERKGFAGEAFTFKPPRGLMETDFSEQVELDRSGEVRRSDKIVMRVKVNDGAAHGVPSYWRGATHDLYRDGRWHRAMGLRGLARDEWRGARGQFYRRAGNGNVSVTVVLENRDSKRLFLPDNAARIRMVAPADRMLLRPDLDATIHCNWGSFAPGRIEYLAALDGGYREPGGSPRTRRYDAWLHVNRREVPRRMQATARDLRRRLGDDAPQFQIVEVMRQYLANGYGYLAPGENGGATSLAQFFEERR